MRRYGITCCVRCGCEIPKVTKKKWCAECRRITRNEYSTARFARNFAAGLCRCGRPRATGESKSFCYICLTNRRKNAPKYLPGKRQQSLEARLILKQEVFAHYGNACACCGETTIEFFEMDHAGGWGKDHRKVNGVRFAGNALYRWIKKNNFPDGFRILCGSCHSAISYWGYCPHESARLVKETSNSDVTTGLSTFSSGEADNTLQAVVGPELAV